MTRTCTMGGCSRKHQAQGLCKPHYNRQRYGNHRYLITCTLCLSEHMSARRNGKYCSDTCKAIDYTKPKTCPVPASHPSRRDPLPTSCRVWIKDCAWCGNAFAGRMPHSSTCSRHCSRKRGRLARRAREHGAPGTHTWSQVMRIHMLFNRQCAYCSAHIPGLPDPDHVVPLSRGGHNSIGNILPCCRACNADKRDLLLHEWNDDRRRRGLCVRTTTWLLTDRRYAHLHADIIRAA
jgi:HNH endonuclease